MLFTVHSTGRFKRKADPCSGFKNSFKKIRETRKQESIHEKLKNEGRKPYKD
jgi:hypothetical protein